jgi:hypothetical protein
MVITSTNIAFYNDFCLFLFTSLFVFTSIADMILSFTTMCSSIGFPTTPVDSLLCYPSMRMGPATPLEIHLIVVFEVA